MKKFIFILGGAKSGKSSYAVSLAKKFSKKVAFIATATALDEEMKERIKFHKLSRPKYWKTIEESKDIVSCLSQAQKDKYEVVLIDCLGLLVSNLLADGLNDREIEKKMKSLANIVLKLNAIVILVSNEVGSGIVPENHLARRFRDIVGLANQTMSKKAEEVVFMQSGLPIIIKKGEQKNEQIK